jgi:hypothetical protein
MQRAEPGTSCKVDVMRKATSHAPRIVDGAGSVGAAPAEEGKKPATRIASDSPARIFIPCHLFSIIIVLTRRINGGGDGGVVPLA